MNRKHLLKYLSCVVLPVALIPSLFAQENPKTDSKPGTADEPIQLSPFVVSSAEDTGYFAKDTLAGTRIRTDIKDVGSSISVITAKFLQDTNSTNATQLLVYTPNTEVSGQGGNFLGIGDAGFAGQVRYGQTRVRGLTSADNTRDFFLTDIPWDSYNTGRVDIQRGPNSILFGIGSPAGIVNASLNHAAFKDSNRVENKVDNYGSIRFSGDFNKVLIDKELAIRVSFLNDNTKFRQDPAFRDDTRGYASVRWDPAFLNKGSMHTSLEASYEKGRIRSNLPRPAPPFDYLTPWFGSLQSLQANGADIRNAQTLANSHTLYGLTVGAAEIQQGGVILAYNQGRSTNFNFQENTQNPYTGDGFIAGIGGSGSYINNFTSVLGSTLKAWKNRVITDRSIFDSYDVLLDGDSKGEFNNFHALDVAFRQSFLNDTLGYEIAYDQQYVHDGSHNFLSEPGYGIAIDVMGNTLGGIKGGTPNPAGGLYDEIPNPVNPNLGRAYVWGGSGSGFNWNTREKSSLRLTTFYDLDFKKLKGADSFLGRIFGENRFTGLASQFVDRLATAGGGDYKTDDGFAAYEQEGHRAYIFDYLTGSKLTGTSAANLHLPGITTPVIDNSYSVKQFDGDVTQSWITRPFSLITNFDLPESQRQYTSASLKQTTVNSEAVVWQGYWLDSLVIPMVAWRRDSAFQRDAGNAPSNKVKLTNPLNGNNFTDTYYQPYSPNYVLGEKTPTTTITSHTFSVVTHLPKQWRAKLPGNLDVQLIYNQSENFQPQPGRVDIENRPLPDPSGRTKEYGIAISALHDKLYLKVAHYETHEDNANLGDIGNIPGTGIGSVAAVETWARTAAYIHQKVANTGQTEGWQADKIYGVSSDGHAVSFKPYGPQSSQVSPGSNDVYLGLLPNEPFPPGTVRSAYTQAEIDATWAVEKASIDAILANPPSDGFLKATGISKTDFNDPSLLGGIPISGSTANGAITGSTVSKGTEFELVASPLKGLTVSLNASRTDASRVSIAQSFIDYLEARRALFFNTPAGDMRLWSSGEDDNHLDPYTTQGDGNATFAFKDKADAPLSLFLASEGTQAPEVHPWAFNGVANYAFQSSGYLKGFNVGGGYRWQDRNIIGYAVKKDEFGNEVYDVAHPYLGPTEDAVDLWVGYERRISRRFKWRTQLNVRNVFANDKLIKAQANPDGSGAAYRIPEPRTITFTNSIEF